LVIDRDNQELACSPDGIVLNKRTKEIGLIEIKNLLKDKALTLNEAVSKTSNFCLQLDTNGCLKLKPQHAFYYQCQGVLNIVQKEWLDFVVRTERPYQLHVERIYRDQTLWNETMLPKLKSFYTKCMLPELAASRNDVRPGIREPKFPWVSRIKNVGKNSSTCKCVCPRERVLGTCGMDVIVAISGK
jgi:hypothetical protein